MHSRLRKAIDKRKQEIQAKALLAQSRRWLTLAHCDECGASCRKPCVDENNNEATQPCVGRLTTRQRTKEKNRDAIKAIAAASMTC